MLDLKWILDNAPEARRRLAQRGVELDTEGLSRINEERKAFQKRAEDLRAARNRASEDVARAKKEGRDAAEVIAAMKKVGDDISALEENIRSLEAKLRADLLSIPNLPAGSVPEGRAAEDNVEVRRFGDPPRFSFRPEPHWEIGRRLGLLDFDRAAKIAGARFAVSLSEGARLERALISFMLDIHTRESGYTEVLPPFIANEDSLIGTGNLPKFAEDLFKIEGFKWYLIPTAEVPLTNLFRDEILDESSLPRRFAAYTPCFRSEAGSYGKDIRGLIRQHQFNKVEIVAFSLPEKSFEELERMTVSAEEVLRRLELPYRVVELCAGDLGFASAKTYDLEVWMPERNGYVEISSCSNCTDFQARRANIRFRRAPKSKPEHVHTLNGSGVAVGRTVAALLECGQQKNGTVRIPAALRPYMDGLEKIGS
ncbi:MAG: serine--tRNA ligase [Candidatus Aminicenantes bacterium]|nr:serine--tRNA ligase [Candidatus Aminicenantes bacterium]